MTSDLGSSTPRNQPEDVKPSRLEPATLADAAIATSIRRIFDVDLGLGSLKHRSGLFCRMFARQH